MIINLVIFIAFCTILGFFIQERSKYYSSVSKGIKYDWQICIVFIIMLMSFILFSALRTRYNDTTTYTEGFMLVEAENICYKTIFEPYGGFMLFQQLLKKYISENPQILIIAATFICVPITIKFIIDLSSTFGTSIFLYSIGSFLFSMAGIKQAIAMAFAMMYIKNIEKKKYISAIMFMLIAMSFHPYVICLVVIPFMRSGILDIKTLIIVAGTVFLILNLDKFLEIIATIGKEYEISEFVGNTINPFRIIIESIPILIIIIFRKEIQIHSSPLINMGINMRIISFTCLFLGLFMDPIYLGRIATYFEVISFITVPQILNIAFKRQRNGSLYKNAYYVIFFIYWFLDMTKLGSISVTRDLFGHISIIEAFKIFIN